MRTTTQVQRTATVLFAGLAAAALALAMIALTPAAPAHAAAYRFWSYWQGATGQWVMAQTGPSEYQLVDEDVQGWRFAISTEEISQKPDNSPDFAALCPDLAAAAAPSGELRVAVVVDSGFVAEAPAGQTPPADVVSCVTVPEGSTGAQALAAAATVTESGGLICAVNGYPADECSAEVSDADAAAAAAAAATESPNPAVVAGPSASAPADPASTSETASPAWFVGGVVVLAALVAAAFGIPALRRRQRESRDADGIDGTV